MVRLKLIFRANHSLFSLLHSFHSHAKSIYTDFIFVYLSSEVLHAEFYKLHVCNMHVLTIHLRNK